MFLETFVLAKSTTLETNIFYAYDQMKKFDHYFFYDIQK